MCMQCGDEPRTPAVPRSEVWSAREDDVLSLLRRGRGKRLHFTLRSLRGFRRHHANGCDGVGGRQRLLTGEALAGSARVTARVEVAVQTTGLADVQSDATLGEVALPARKSRRSKRHHRNEGEKNSGTFHRE